jgi:Gpi18-like mannosyltransferase
MHRPKLPSLINLLGATTLERCLTVALIVVAMVARLIPGPRTIDDAFITFRYARNIVHGVGFVYNAGERVLGTTTPLYTLWMAALALITRSENYPLLALVTNAVADAASVYLLYHLGRRLSNSPLVGWVAALLWAISPMSVTFAIGGMETSVFILLMLGTFAAHLERRTYLTAVLAALALLTRPDAAQLPNLERQVSKADFEI